MILSQIRNLALDAITLQNKIRMEQALQEIAGLCITQEAQPVTTEESNGKPKRNTARRVSRTDQA